MDWGESIRHQTIVSKWVNRRKPSNGAGSASSLMSDFEYESLLDRARSNIPEEISNRARWTLPDPQIMIEG